MRERPQKEDGADLIFREKDDTDGFVVASR